MRAKEFVIESEIKHLNVGGTDIGVHPHIFDQAIKRDVTPHSIDIVLRHLPSFLDQIHQLEPGQTFYITHERLNVSLGFRYSGSRKIVLMTTVPSSQPYARGENPVFRISE